VYLWARQRCASTVPAKGDLEAVCYPLVQGNVTPVELRHYPHDAPGLDVGEGGQSEDGRAEDVISVPMG